MLTCTHAHDEDLRVAIAEAKRLARFVAIERDLRHDGHEDADLLAYEATMDDDPDAADYHTVGWWAERDEPLRSGETVWCSPLGLQPVYEAHDAADTHTRRVLCPDCGATVDTQDALGDFAYVPAHPHRGQRAA